MCHLEIHFKLNHRAPHVPYKVLESYGITEFALEEFSSERTQPSGSYNQLLMRIRMDFVKFDA